MNLCLPYCFLSFLQCPEICSLAFVGRMAPPNLLPVLGIKLVEINLQWTCSAAKSLGLRFPRTPSLPPKSFLRFLPWPNMQELSQQNVKTHSPTVGQEIG